MTEFNARCLHLAAKEALGRDKEPKTPEEFALVADKLTWVRSQCGIFDYQPHWKQEVFHRSRCKVKYFQGSNQSGKTTCSIVEAIEWMEGVRLHTGEPMIHPVTGEPVRPPVRIAYELDDLQNKVMEVLVPKMKELIPWDACVTKVHTVQGGSIHKLGWWNGSSIKMLSYEQMPKKHEGYTWDAVFFDEPPPRWAYIAAFRGTIKTAAPLHFANTPISEQWLQESIVEAPATIRVNSMEDFDKIKKHNTCMVVVSFPEITHISEEEKDLFASQLSEEEKAARIFGEALHLQGRVFKSYTDKPRQLCDEDLETMSEAAGIHWSEWPWGQVVDPHDRRPYAVGWFVISPREELIWVREWPDYEYYSVRNCENQVDDYVEIFQKMEDMTFKRPCCWRRMDPRFGRTPKATSNTTLAEEYELRGLVYDVSFSDDQLLETGHHKISKYLADNRLFVHEACHNMHRAFLHYVRDDWVRDDGTKPAKEGRSGVKERHKDFIDIVRYALDDEPGWIPPFNPARTYTIPQNGGLLRGP